MDTLVFFLSLFLYILSNNSNITEACAPTAPAVNPIVTSTADPVELNRCAETSLTLVPAMTTPNQQFIDVTRSGYTYTRIGTTLDTISTMMVSCTAANGFTASMETDNNGVLENEVTPPPSTVTIKVSCSSVDRKWFYETVVNGEPFRREITDVSCQQIPATTPLRRCAQDSLPLRTGDTMNPQEYIDVISSGYTSTQIGTTQETISTMMVSCTAIDGYLASMDTDADGVFENEVMPPPQTVTVKVTCNSADMKWYYETVYMGAPFTRQITNGVSCRQVPRPLERCDPTSLTLAQGDTNSPQQNIDVTRSGYTSTQIGTTQDTISTMMVMCTAIDGYYASMETDGDGVQENDVMPPPQTVSIKVTCSSVDRKWFYETVVNGATVTKEITNQVSCQQIPELKTCPENSLTLIAGDAMQPQGNIDVISSGYTSTQIGNTQETISTMMVSCTAIDTYTASLLTDGNDVLENEGEPQTVTIKVTCNSADMKWFYETIFNGQPFTREIMNDVSCQQVPRPLRRCEQSSLTLRGGDTDTPQEYIAVTSSGYTSTQIGTTLDTISTMMVSCTAIDGYLASMDTDADGVFENEVMPPPQIVTVKVTCNSADMKWYYETVFNGQPFTREILNDVSCRQIPRPLERCDPTSLALVQGDTNSPQQNIDVTSSGYTSTQIGTTQDTVSTMMVMCTAIDGYYASMETDSDPVQENEVVPPPQTVTIKVTCSSVDRKWFYETVVNGATVTKEITTDVSCLQLPIPVTDPPPTCGASSLLLGTGDMLQPQQSIDVTTINYSSTIVGGVTTATMQVTCTAIQGYNAYMTFNGGFPPPENLPPTMPRTVTINVSCSSTNGAWVYNTVFNGMTITRTIVANLPVLCQQIPNSG